MEKIIRFEHKFKIAAFRKLGKEIKISPKSHTVICEPGVEFKFGFKSVYVPIGIGDSFIGYLIMDYDAFAALNAGSSVSITTQKEFDQQC